MLSDTSATALFATCYTVATCTLCLKLFTRVRYVNGLELDDYLVSLTWMILTAAMGTIFVMIANGLQSPEATWFFFPAEKLETLLKTFFISVQLYTIGILFSKLSLIYLYKRITRNAPSLYLLNHFLSALAAICTFFTILGVILNFLWCRPLRAFWSFIPFPQLPQYCSDDLEKISVYLYSGYNIVTDILIMCVPYFFLSKAALRSRSQRIALLCLFSIGFLVIASTMIKIIAIAGNFETSSLVLWSLVEACVALICTSLPSLPPLIWRSAKLRGLSDIDHQSSLPQRLPDSNEMQDVESDKVGGLRLNKPLPTLAIQVRNLNVDLEQQSVITDGSIASMERKPQDSFTFIRSC